ncbi:hypothetical protein GCM10020331_098030 [Ectobacillus funiculus]
MLSRNIDGLIVEPTKSSSYNPNMNYYLELEQNHIPYLMINQVYPQLNPPHIIVNDENGGFIATEHLIKLGHERIIGLFLRLTTCRGAIVCKVLYVLFRENNISLFPEMIITYATGKHELERMLEKKLKELFVSPKNNPYWNRLL